MSPDELRRSIREARRRIAERPEWMKKAARFEGGRWRLLDADFTIYFAQFNNKYAVEGWDDKDITFGDTLEEALCRALVSEECVK